MEVNFFFSLPDIRYNLMFTFFPASLLYERTDYIYNFYCTRQGMGVISNTHIIKLFLTLLFQASYMYNYICSYFGPGYMKMMNYEW